MEKNNGCHRIEISFYIELMRLEASTTIYSYFYKTFLKTSHHLSKYVIRIIVPENDFIKLSLIAYCVLKMSGGNESS